MLYLAFSTPNANVPILLFIILIVLLLKKDLLALVNLIGNISYSSSKGSKLEYIYIYIFTINKRILMLRLQFSAYQIILIKILK